jgi:hypothetical protein
MQQLAAAAGLSTLSDAVRALSELRSSDSLISYTRSARVEPITMVDAACIYNEMTPDVMQSLLSIFAGYYLQGWAMSATLGNISVIKQLEKFSPNRDPLASGLGRLAAGLESSDSSSFTLSREALNFARNRLPRPGDRRNASLAMESVALEASPSNAHIQTTKTIAAQLAAGAQPINHYANFDAKTNPKVDDIKEIHEVANLSVGKLIKVNLKGDNGNSIDIPVAIRLLVNDVPTESLLHILSIGSKDNSFKERYHAWRSGQISLIKDLILNCDLIDEHRRTLMKDTTGLYQSIMNRSKANSLAGVITMSPSVATASNIAVVSSNTAAQLEGQIGGKLSNFSVRQKVFEKTYLMLLAVIDADRDRVTIYHRGIPESTSLNHRELKMSNKGSGPDVADILRAYKSGTSPQF